MRAKCQGETAGSLPRRRATRPQTGPSQKDFIVVLRLWSLRHSGQAHSKAEAKASSAAPGRDGHSRLEPFDLSSWRSSASSQATLRHPGRTPRRRTHSGKQVRAMVNGMPPCWQSHHHHPKEARCPHTWPSVYNRSWRPCPPCPHLHLTRLCHLGNSRQHHRTSWRHSHSN